MDFQLQDCTRCHGLFCTSVRRFEDCRQIQPYCKGPNGISKGRPRANEEGSLISRGAGHRLHQKITSLSFPPLQPAICFHSIIARSFWKPSSRVIERLTECAPVGGRAPGKRLPQADGINSNYPVQRRLYTEMTHYPSFSGCRDLIERLQPIMGIQYSCFVGNQLGYYGRQRAKSAGDCAILLSWAVSMILQMLQETQKQRRVWGWKMASEASIT